MTFLDEPENPMLVEFIDYIGKGNRIQFNYLEDWKSKEYKMPEQFNLQSLLNHLYKLYCDIPPVPFDDVYIPLLINKFHRVPVQN